MTVSTTDSVIEYVSGGPAFPIPYRFLQNSDIQAVLVKQDGASETLVLGTQYTLIGAGAQSGGTLTSAYAAGYLATPGAILTISRIMSPVQPTDLRNQGRFLAETHETVFDRLTMLVQQGFAIIGRALLRPIGKNYYDAQGRQIKNVGDPTDAQDATTKSWVMTQVNSVRTDLTNLAYTLYNQSIAYVESLVAGVVGGYGSFLQAGLGAIARTFQSKMRDTVSPCDFGAVGDYYTDDTEALQKADDYCYSVGKTLDLGDGNYRVTRSFVRRARWKGNFAPTLGTFPITADDKIYMRPGYKHLMPGCSIWLDGVFAGVQTTSRTDRFSSFTYGIMTDPAAGTPHIEGIALIVDMDVFDAAGNITSVATDNRSDVDVAYYHTTGWTNHNDFVVFGYPKKAGKFVHGADIDYNTFDEDCSTSGDIGLAICGNGVTGLSGTRYAGEIYANDHHSRSIIDNQWGTCALYVDGAIPSASAPQNSIGGHYFTGSIRTYTNNPFILDHANTVVFDGCVFEWPNMAGSVGATMALPVGSANTYGVVFENCRHLSPIGVNGIYQFANSIGGAFIHSDPRHGNLGVAYAGVGGFIRANGGNPTLQLTTDINGTTKGWTQLMNVASSNRLEMRYENAQGMLLTSAGTLTANRLVAVLTGSSSAADPSVRLSGSDASTGLYRPGANNIAVSVAGTKVMDWQADGIPRPGADNTYSFGSGSFRWSQIYAATGTINTSDERVKDIRGELSEQEVKAWASVRGLVFRFKDAIQSKGQDARLHAGYSAQVVHQAFIDAGLDPAEYGLWCEDEIRKPIKTTVKSMRQKMESRLVKRLLVTLEDGKAVSSWEVVPEDVPVFDSIPMVGEDDQPLFESDGSQQMHLLPVMEEFDEEVEAYEVTGTRMGLRYEECAIFESAYLRSVIADQAKRIQALEDKASA